MGNFKMFYFEIPLKSVHYLEFSIRVKQRALLVVPYMLLLWKLH